jgi:hypothetical protein
LESVNQDKNEENDTIPIFLVTHKAYEKDIRNAINEIDQLPEIQAPSTLIRILDE